jgi:hypothetical protein
MCPHVELLTESTVCFDDHWPVCPRGNGAAAALLPFSRRCSCPHPAAAPPGVQSRPMGRERGVKGRRKRGGPSLLPVFADPLDPALHDRGVASPPPAGPRLHVYLAPAKLPSPAPPPPSPGERQPLRLSKPGRQAGADAPPLIDPESRRAAGRSFRGLRRWASPAGPFSRRVARRSAPNTLRSLLPSAPIRTTLALGVARGPLFAPHREGREALFRRISLKSVNLRVKTPRCSGGCRRIELRQP